MAGQCSITTSSMLLLPLLSNSLQDHHHQHHGQAAPASEHSLHVRSNRLKHAKATGSGRVYTSRCVLVAVALLLTVTNMAWLLLLLLRLVGLCPPA
jgi:hypothetical protein